MNQVYRVIFNHAVGVYQCVCEFAKSAGKTKAIKTATVVLAVAVGTQAMAENQRYEGENKVLPFDYNASGDVITKNSTITARSGITVNKNDFEVNGNSRLTARTIQLLGKNMMVADKSDVITDGISVVDNSTLTLNNSQLKLDKTGSLLLIGDSSKHKDVKSIANITNESMANIGELFVGRLSHGALNVNGGSQVTIHDHFNIGSHAQGQGQAVISDLNTKLTAKNKRPTRIGDGGQGELVVKEGAKAELSDLVVGLNAPNKSSQVHIKDTASSLAVDNEISIGDSSRGELVIDQASVKTNKLIAGYFSKGDGGIDVIGLGANLQAETATLGRAGKGSLTIDQGATVSITNNFDLADSSIDDYRGTGKLVIDGANLEDNASKLTVKNGLLNIGLHGEASVELKNNGTIVAGKDVSIGKFAGAKGSVTVNRGKILVVGDASQNFGDLFVGEAGGQGSLVATNESVISTTKDFVIGRSDESVGDVRIENSHAIIANDLIVGKEGKATLLADKEALFDVGLNTYVGQENNYKTTQITLNNDGTLRTQKLIFDGRGQNTLTLNDGTLVLEKGLERSHHAQANVLLDGGQIAGARGRDIEQIELFKNFEQAHKIEIGNKGAIFNAQKNQTLKIADTARLTGQGKLEKVGEGTLQLSAHSKQWQGGTHIYQGVVQLDGNYTMHDGEVLQIGVEDQKDYGKLKVNGEANISQGILAIKAADAIHLLKTGQWQDIVTANKIVGQFKQVQNINPLVNFDVQYENGKVHLNVKPPVTKVPPTAPTVPEKPKGTPPQSVPPVVPPKAPPQPKPETKVPPTAPTAPAKPEGVPPVTQVPPTAPTVPEKPKGTPPASKPKAKPMPPKMLPKPEKKTPPVDRTAPEKPKEMSKVPPTAPTVPEKPKGTPPKNTQPAPQPSPVPPVVPTPVPTPPVVPQPKPVPPMPTFKPVFSQSAQAQRQHRLLNLAHELDSAYLQVVQKHQDNALGKALIADSDGLKGKTDEQTQHNLNQISRQLQPLVMGVINESLVNVQRQTAIAVHHHVDTPQGVWVSVFGGQDKKESLADGLTGYTQKDKGVVVGASTPVGTGNVGVALSHSDSRVQAQDMPHHAKLATTGISTYANKHFGATRVQGHIGVSQATINGERHLDILKAGVAQSNYRANVADIGFGVHHQFGTDNHHLAPFMTIGYTQVFAKGYREFGTPNYDLTVAKSRYHSFYGQVGVAGKYQLADKLSATGRVSALYDNGDKNSVVHAHFSQTPTARFSTLGERANRYATLATAGLEYQVTPKVKAALDYQGQWRQGFDSHGVQAGVSMVF